MKIAGSGYASESICKRHGSADTDPHQNVMDPKHWCQERLTANARVATVLGSTPASSDTVNSDARQMKQC
jgi:hypothetical protein